MPPKIAAVQIPGEDQSIPGASQPGDPEDPAEIAELRERQLQGVAMAEAAAEGREADIAPAPDIKPRSRKAEKPGTSLRRMHDGRVIEVRVSTPRQDSDVDIYGPESELAHGTAVRKDGSRCPPGEKRYGVIGNIKTDRGWVVNRIVPDGLETV